MIFYFFLLMHYGGGCLQNYHRMVLYFLTYYRLLGIVYLDQLQGARHTHTSYHNKFIEKP